MNDQQAAFVERIAAAATHEIMNGLASVGQSAGLMQDLLELGLVVGLRARLRKIFSSGSQAGRDPEQRLKKSLLAVGHSMEKTMRTTRALNRFLHSLTPSQEQVPISQVLEVAAELMQPFARQKKSKIRLLECEAKDRSFPVNPLLAYQALATCIEVFLDKTSQDELSLACQSKQEGMVLTVQSCKLQPAEEDVPVVKEICPDLAALDCAIEKIASGLAISLPY